MPAHDRRNGIPLNEAPYYFAPPQLRAQYDNPKIPPTKVSRGTQLMLNSISEDHRNDFLKAWQQVQIRIDTWHARSDIERQMRERLLDSLGRRKLVAYGYSLPRKVTNRPQNIPEDLFQPKFIDWQQSAIKGAGLHFVSVVMFRSNMAAEIDAVLAKRASRAELNSKRGPQSSKYAIEAAIQSLIESGQLPNSRLQKENIGMIRSRIHELYPDKFPDDRGLGKETIRTTLAELIPRTPK